jgi:hypothetical protein
MLLGKKTLVMIVPARSSRKNLEHLYARRSALDALIQSLEEYDRFRERRLSLDKRKTA